MPIVFADRVKVRTRTSGTGTLTLENTVDGFQSFAAVGNGNQTYYGIEHPNGSWEIGIGTYSSVGPTLSRDTVISSSNSNLAVNFDGGSKTVFCTLPSTVVSSLAGADIGGFDFAGNTISTNDNNDITISQNVLPSIDSDGTTGYTLGSPSFQWKELFVSNGSIYIGDVKLSNNAGQLVVQQVTDAGLVTEAPVPDAPGVVTTDRVVNGVHNITMNSTGDFVPNSDILQDLGSPSNRFRHLYVGPGSVYIGNNVITESATGGLVLPGVTRATGYYAEEVEDKDRWGSNPTITGTVTVIDATRYQILAGQTPSAGYNPATYTVEKDGNRIDEINVSDGGSGWTKAEADYARDNNMYATNVVGAINNFNAGDWTQIPFRVDVKAEDTEYEDIFGGGADLGDFSINDNVLEADSATIRTNDGDLTLQSDSDVFVKTSGNNYTWTFGNGGDLTLPEGGTIYNSDGQEIGTGAANTGDITFTDDEIGSTTNVININASEFAQLQSGNSYIWVEGESGAYVQIGSKTFEFDVRGALRLPEGGDILNSSGQSVLGGGSNAYTPNDNDDWDTVPSTIQAALDELAARVAALQNFEIDGGNANTPAAGELLIDGNGA